jgi:hypothetical protein
MALSAIEPNEAKRGEPFVAHVSRGQQKGLRIRVLDNQPELLKPVSAVKVWYEAQSREWFRPGACPGAFQPLSSHKMVLFSEGGRALKAGVMKNEPTTTPSQGLALERFAAMTKIQDLLRQGFPLSLALEQVSCCPLTLPNGTQRPYARRTFEDWWYEY